MEDKCKEAAIALLEWMLEKGYGVWGKERRQWTEGTHWKSSAEVYDKYMEEKKNEQCIAGE